MYQQGIIPIHFFFSLKQEVDCVHSEKWTRHWHHPITIMAERISHGIVVMMTVNVGCFLIPIKCLPQIWFWMRQNIHFTAGLTVTVFSPAPPCQSRIQKMRRKHDTELMSLPTKTTQQRHGGCWNLCCCRRCQYYCIVVIRTLYALRVFICRF